MATSSTPGGSIPSFITESSMPGQISAVWAHLVTHCCMIHLHYRTFHIFSNGSTLCARRETSNTRNVVRLEYGVVKLLCAFTRALDIFPLEDIQGDLYYVKFALAFPIGHCLIPHKYLMFPRSTIVFDEVVTENFASDTTGSHHPGGCCLQRTWQHDNLVKSRLD